MQGVVVKKQVAPEVWDALKGLTQESALIVTGTVRADKRAPGGYEMDISDAAVVQKRAGSRALSDLAQGAWRRLPDGAPPSLGALAAPGGHSAHPRGDR